MAIEEIQGRRYVPLQAVALSLFSPALYRDVALHWRGIGLGYLFLLLALAWVPTMGMLQAEIDDFATEVAPSLLDKLPTITITNGEATIDAAGPVVLRDPRNGTVLAVLDPGEEAPPGTEKAYVALTKKTLVVRRPDQRDARVVHLIDSPFANAVVDRERAAAALATVQRWFVLTVAYPACLLGSWLYRTAEALLYAAVAFRIATWLRRGLGWRACLRLAAVALTPVVVLDTVIGIIGTPPPLWPLSYFLLTVGYVYLGVSAVPPVAGAAEAHESVG